jgi:hypothetical protein
MYGQKFRSLSKLLVIGVHGSGVELLRWVPVPDDAWMFDFGADWGSRVWQLRIDSCPKELEMFQMANAATFRSL